MVKCVGCFRWKSLVETEGWNDLGAVRINDDQDLT